MNVADPKKEYAPGLATGGDDAASSISRKENSDRENITRNNGETKDNSLSVARDYLARGLTPIRLAPGEKKPRGKYDAETVTAENAERLLGSGTHNLGLRLGPEFGHLVDFDLDWPEARRLAEPFLFALARFGREGARGSHYLLRCSGPIKSMKYDLPALKGTPGLPDEHACCVLEVRASGQTMAPPSIHPNGAKVTWERDAPLIEWDADEIKRRAGLLAFLSLAARFYPPAGSRDDFCMALSGALLTAGLSGEDAGRCVVAVADAAGDEEAGKRDKAGATALKIAAGEPVTGLPRVVEMMGLPESVVPKLREWLGIKSAREDDRPTVLYSENRLHETLAKAEDALIASGLPLYQQGDRIVTPVRLDVSEASDGVKRPAGALVLRELSAPLLRVMMTKAANFEKPGSKGGTVPCGVPESFPSAYLALAGAWRLPVLRGIASAPTLRPNGTVLDAEGYDPETGQILDFGGVGFLPVPDSPSSEDVKAALETLKDVLKGFPFVDDAARSVALSAILTALIRRSLRTAPLHGITAPTFGTGKSLLTEVVAMIATGADSPASMSLGRGDDEDEKRLLSVLMQGDPIVLIDNVLKPIEGGSLATILTSESWQGRILGVSKMKPVSTRVLFLANGNNLGFSEDLVTRAIVCRMDAKMEDPETRTFDRDLRTYVPANRARLVQAALTILRGYAAAGYPRAADLTPFGRFEEWSRAVRGALVWAGEADPCLTRDAVAAGDEGTAELAALIAAWSASMPPLGEVTAPQLLDRAGDWTDTARDGKDRVLWAALEACCPRGTSPKAVGVYLSRVQGRVVGGKRIVRHDRGKHAGVYTLEVMKEEGSGVS